MLRNAPNPVDVQDFQFKLRCRLKVFENKESGPFSNNCNLVAAASRFGLFFVGNTSASFQVIQTNAIHESNGDIGIDYARREIPLPSPPTYLATNCEHTILAVVTTRDGCPFVTFYDVLSFLSQKIAPAGEEVRLSPTPGVTVLQTDWNPTLGAIFTACKSDGTLGVYELKQPGGVDINELPAAAGATCFCWSPKGKQIAVGSRDGKITQYKPDLKAVKMIGAPQLKQQPHSLISLQWVSNYQFVGVYQSANPNDGACLIVVDAPKTGEPVFTNYDDVCYSNGNTRPPQFYTILQQNWNVLLVGSSNSMEIGVLGLAGDSWSQWIMGDAARAELPLSPDHQETLPVGMALDISSTQNLSWGENVLPPAPILLLLSHHGTLCCFNVINLKENLPTICTPPDPVHNTSGLGFFSKPKPIAKPVVLSIPQPVVASTPVPQQAQPQQQFATPPQQVQPAQSLYDTPKSAAQKSVSFSSSLFSPPASAAQQPLSFGQCTLTPILKQPGQLPQQQQPQQQPLPKATISKIPLYEIPTSAELPPAVRADEVVVVGGGGISQPPAPLPQSPVVTSMQPPSNFVKPTLPQSTGFSAPALPDALPSRPASLVTLGEAPSQEVVDEKDDPETEKLLNQMVHVEVAFLESNLRAMIHQTRTLKVAPASDQEKNNLVQSTQMLEEFLKEIAEVTSGQSAEVHALKQSLLQSFAWYEEAVSRHVTSKDDKMSVIIRAQPLDSASQKQLEDIRHASYYLVSQLSQANRGLDEQWENFQDYCKKTRKLELPTMEVIFQTMVKQSAIMQKQNYVLKDIASRIKTKSRMPIGPSPLIFNLDNAEEIEREMKSLRLEPVDIYQMQIDQVVKRAQHLTPAKVNNLRSFLTKRPLREIKASETIFGQSHLPSASELKGNKVKPNWNVHQGMGIAVEKPRQAQKPEQTPPQKTLSSSANVWDKMVSISSSGSAFAPTFAGSKANKVGGGPDLYSTPPHRSIQNMDPQKYAMASYPVVKPTPTETGMPPTSAQYKINFPADAFSKTTAAADPPKSSHMFSFGSQNQDSVKSAFSAPSSISELTSKYEEAKGDVASKTPSSIFESNKPGATQQKISSTGTSSFAPVSSIFTASTKGSIFGGTSADSKPMFGTDTASTKGSIFGGTSAESKPMFGTATTSAGATSIFAQAAAASFAGSDFGGLGAAPAFAKTPAASSAFKTSTAAVSAFANPTTATPVTSTASTSIPSTPKSPPALTAFGIATTTAFGVPSTGTTSSLPTTASTTASTSVTTTGVTTSTFAAPSTGGSSIFGTPSSSIFAAAPSATTSVFAAPTSSTAASIFGTSTFASSTTAPTGGISASIFGTSTFAPSTTAPVSSAPSSLLPKIEPIPSTSSSVFAANTTSTASSAFSTSTPTSSIFAGVPAASGTTTASVFGGKPADAAPATTSVFGAASGTTTFGTTPAFSTSSVTSATSSVFSSTPASSASIFGSAAPTTSASVFADALKTSASVFGASTPSSTPSVFGTSSTPTSSIFGGAPTTSASVFGGTPTSTVFGGTPASTSASVFGGTPASTTASVFGGTPASTTASVFGGTPTSAFGGATPSFGGTTSAFGAPTSSTTSSFGATSTAAASVFGTATSTSAFGGTAPASSSSSIFGGSGASTLPGFGGAFGATTPSVFGGTSTTSTPFAGSAPFGAAAPAAASQQPFGGGTTSFEAAKTTASVFGGTPAVFGGSSSAFGSTAPFGQSSSGSIFATQAAVSSSFGSSTPTTSTPSAFGSASPSVFGSSTASSAASSPFGNVQTTQPSFGGNTAASFGFGSLNVGSTAPTAGGFGGQGQQESGGAAANPFGAAKFGGAQQQDTKSLFGSSTPSAFGGSPFGGSNTSGTGVAQGFGSPSTFGVNTPGQPPAFGQQSTFGSGGGGFSSSGAGGPFSSGAAASSGSVQQTGFGAASPQQQAFQKSPTSGFGGAPVFGSASPAFGGSPSFGGSPAFGGAPAFGSPGKIFGAASPTTGFGAPAPQQQSSTFGNLANQQTVGFGNLATQPTVGFGNLAQQAATPPQPQQFSGAPSFSSWR